VRCIFLEDGIKFSNVYFVNFVLKTLQTFLHISVRNVIAVLTVILSNSEPELWV